MTFSNTCIKPFKYCRLLIPFEKKNHFQSNKNEIKIGANLGKPKRSNDNCKLSQSDSQEIKFQSDAFICINIFHQMLYKLYLIPYKITWDDSQCDKSPFYTTNKVRHVSLLDLLYCIVQLMRLESLL